MRSGLKCPEDQDVVGSSVCIRSLQTSTSYIVYNLVYFPSILAEAVNFSQCFNRICTLSLTTSCVR